VEHGERRTNESWAWASYTRSFSITSPKAYTQYRLVLTPAAGATGITLAEIELLGTLKASKPAPTQATNEPPKPNRAQPHPSPSTATGADRFMTRGRWRVPSPSVELGRRSLPLRGSAEVSSEVANEGWRYPARTATPSSLTTLERIEGCLVPELSISPDNARSQPDQRPVRSGRQIAARGIAKAR